MKTGGDDWPPTKPSRDIVVIGGSAGALDAMVRIAAGLPGNYAGSLFVVSHIGRNPSQLPELLTEAGPLPAHHARHEEEILPGRIYVAPPDRHLLLADGRVLLSGLPREHFTRPAIDPLFRTAARAYRRRVVGIVLSGTGSDGAIGLNEIRKAGGIALVQAPGEAAFPEMPDAAMRAVAGVRVVSTNELAGSLVRLIEEQVGETTAEEAPVTTEMDLEPPFALTCPECGGAVHEVPGTGIINYRCHTGHRFSADELLHQQGNDVERAIMVAIRVLRERTALCRRMIDEARSAGRSHGIAYWTDLKREADDQLRVLQRSLQQPAAVETTMSAPAPC